MMSITSTIKQISILTACLVCVSIFPEYAGGSHGGVIFMEKETFRVPLGDEWTWIRENPKTHRITEKGLEIQLEPGSLMGSGEGVKNILVRPIPKDAHYPSVYVEFTPQNQYEQAGLILYTNDNQYIKLVKEFVDGKPWIVMAVEIDGKNPLVKKVPAPKGKVKIRYWLDSAGDKVWGMHEIKKETGSEWIQIGSHQFPMSPRPKIGVFTQNGQPNQERWARFSDFLTFWSQNKK